MSACYDHTSEPGVCSGHVTTIGPTIVMSGELTSGEDITVQGRVNGQVMVEDAAAHHR